MAALHLRLLKLHGMLQKKKKEKKKLPQLINIHEPFTWAPFCVVAGPNPDRDRAVLQRHRLRHSTLCGRNPSTGVSGKCLPPLRALTFPLSHPLPLVPPQHLGQEVLSLRGGHPSIVPPPMQFTAAPTCMKTSVHIWSDHPFCCKWSQLYVPTHDGGRYLNVLILPYIITCQFFGLPKKQV